MGRFLCKSNPCFDFICFIFYISLLGLAARRKNWRLEFYREFFGCLGVREYSKLRKVTVPWQKRLTSARRGLERGEEAAEFIHGTRRLVSMLMTRRGSFVDFSVMNEWKEWRGRRRRRHAIDYAALYHRPGPRSAAPLSPLNGQSLRITGRK